MGSQATRANFLKALARRPAIIHIAAHFLTERDGGKDTAITLGLTPDRAGHPRWELLTADDIRSLQVPGSIVVMSGCSSAVGRVVPAAGLLGLARAWLEAGATAVIATQWPVPDDSGEFFSRFYEYLRDSSRGDRLAPAEALRRAQVDMLRSSASRAEPRYWAAYQVFGRSN
jgi:CHAT domain-containing protein